MARRVTPFLLIILLLAVIIESSEDCTRFVQALSQEDIFLNGRRNLAFELMKANASAQEFVDSLNSPNVPSGEKYQCGNTRFWIDGLYSGPLKQYEELRGSDNGYGTGAGYQDFSGDNDRLLTLFASVIKFIRLIIHQKIASVPASFKQF